MATTKQSILTKRQQLQLKHDKIASELKKCSDEMKELDKELSVALIVPPKILSALKKEYTKVIKPRWFITNLKCEVRLLWEEDVSPTVDDAFPVDRFSAEKTAQYKQYQKEIAVFWNKVKSIAKEYGMTAEQLLTLLV